ncbi:TPA: nucleotide exchange factor GrpE [Candidatus Woesearchaeota archaeon]|nr:nucleotide exchange factor GrpE [Candidatus Woesearchaeota archaeon]
MRLKMTSNPQKQTEDTSKEKAAESPRESSPGLREQAPEQHIETPTPLQEMTELLQRTQANFENYRKQTEKRVEEMKLLAARDIIRQLLPIIDNFQLALKNGSASAEFVKGMELIYAQLLGTLEENGIKTIHSEHQQFDPYLHEPLLRADSELPENSIIEEFQQGFTFHGQVLRHAKVKISSGKKPAK